jgi:hypothetical protein
MSYTLSSNQVSKRPRRLNSSYQPCQPNNVWPNDWVTDRKLKKPDYQFSIAITASQQDHSKPLAPLYLTIGFLSRPGMAYRQRTCSRISNDNGWCQDASRLSIFLQECSFFFIIFGLVDGFACVVYQLQLVQLGGSTDTRHGPSLNEYAITSQHLNADSDDSENLCGFFTLCENPLWVFYLENI